MLNSSKGLFYLLSTLVLSHGWPLKQIDINNVLLHGSLNQEVFIIIIKITKKLIYIRKESRIDLYLQKFQDLS